MPFLHWADEIIFTNSPLVLHPALIARRWQIELLTVNLINTDAVAAADQTSSLSRTCECLLEHMCILHHPLS